MLPFLKNAKYTWCKVKGDMTNTVIGKALFLPDCSNNAVGWGLTSLVTYLYCMFILWRALYPLLLNLYVYTSSNDAPLQDERRLISKALFCHRLISTALFCHRLISTALFCHRLISKAWFCHRLISKAWFCHRLISKALLCHRLISKALFWRWLAKWRSGWGQDVYGDIHACMFCHRALYVFVCFQWCSACKVKGDW